MANTSFLASGAIPSPPLFEPAMMSLNQTSGQVPRSAPDYFSLRTNSQRPVFSRTPSGQRRPISPPKTRSSSAEESTLAMVENYKALVAKLRVQHSDERKHLEASRQRAEEVFREERELLEKEHAAELEEKDIVINNLRRQLIEQQGTSCQTCRAGHDSDKRSRNAYVHTMSSRGHSSSSSPMPVQESGRDESGTPVWARAPANPTRTFEEPGPAAQRVDTISLPAEGPIRATSKELSASDFGSGSVSTGTELESIPETPSVDISAVDPRLEGISLKATALAPSFVSNVFSPPSETPARSPNNAPPRPSTTQEDDKPSSKQSSGNNSKANSKTSSPPSKLNLKTLMEKPEDHRLTMNAGHTPSHSIISIADMLPLTETGTATPTAANTQANIEQSGSDGDVELSGQLSMTNEPDDPFVAQLTLKLEQIKEKETSDIKTSPIEEIFDIDKALEEEEEEEIVIKVKTKASMNFGAPLGRF